LAFALIFTSCSKQDISLPEQAALDAILIGEWKVESVKQRIETGPSFVTFTSDVAVGSFTFTPDSTYHSVNFAYSLPNEIDPDVPLIFNLNETRYGNYVISNADQLAVNEKSSNLIITYSTISRTETSMVLYYEFFTDIPGTSDKQKERYTFQLTKL
jgi:hypothetical protein